METSVRTDKLRILAHHLLYGELAHEVFDFRVVNKTVPGKKARFVKGISCGSNGCAMGEMPFIFDDFRPTQDYYIMTHHKFVADYFCMTEPQVACLFYPSPNVDIDCYFTAGLFPDEFFLPPESTKEKVANRILWFSDTIERVNEQASMSTFTYVESENVEVREEVLEI